MPFPAAFGSQLTAVMEALLKALVAGVTAAVEDRVVELRLELRDRERKIRDQERDIEQRDLEILELRAAVEELRAREEAAGSPGEEEKPEETETQIQTQTESQTEIQPEIQTETCQQVWTKEEEDDAFNDEMKWEPTDFLTATSPLRSPQCTTSDTTASNTCATITATGAYSDDRNSSDTSQSFMYSSQETDFSHLPHADPPLDSLLSANQELFSSTGQLAGFRCNQCGKTFTGKARLITHQSVHTGARPYNCHRCGRRFTRRDSVGRHQKLDCCK
ncbi:hypothetical protein NL108_015500 [Boleophthalmus pectinirostris]|uniref:zinc finger and SCAN domain-containing protein 2-like n=1 Tax=Boleophthalmus pectinirostris TaxID=150288 RepID=UPI00242D2171|nr:zinc finger and SCAN domain-containing protein 2-like [Boleophthalmus pectinirostris]KAJ0059324.1 hypothetical protein NL108_015500 [Boleophthalmus pectinirostris]